MNLKTSLDRFRIVAFAEGVSLIVLVGIAVPLKYLAGVHEATLIPGWIHGVLFLLYLVAGVQVAADEEWSPALIAGAFFASLVPGGTFLLDRKLKS